MQLGVALSLIKPVLERVSAFFRGRLTWRADVQGAIVSLPTRIAPERRIDLAPLAIGALPRAYSQTAGASNMVRMRSRVPCRGCGHTSFRGWGVGCVVEG